MLTKRHKDTLIFSGEYKNDKYHGLWQYWHLDGKNHSAVYYENGNKIGLWIEWNADGAMCVRGTNGELVL